MKSWTLRFLVLAVLLLAGALGWRFFFPNPERVIRERLVELAQTVFFGPNEAPLAKLANSQKLGAFVTADVEITVDVPGRSAQTLAGRDELLQAAAAARTQFASLSLEFPDIVVKLGADRASALVNLTAKGQIAGEKDLYVQEFELVMQKREGTWLIRQVTPVKTLR